jgi:3-hydroxyacyl-[acyl-carrier-protein] dehydratase
MSNSFLLNDFYTIESCVKTNESTIDAIIDLNVSHAIFKGHFEQMPVVPGVCQTQIIKELLQDEIKNDLTLTKGNNIKFTGMIVPTQHPKVNVEITYKQENNQYLVDAKLFFENTIFTKFKGTFTQN